MSSHRSEPTKEHECWVAAWSKGGACHDCPVKCYRQGWSAQKVIQDNARLVEEKQKENKSNG